MGRREWKRKIHFKHSQWYCFHNFFPCLIPLRTTLLLDALSSDTVHFYHSQPLPLVLWKALCRGGDKHYLNYSNFLPWHWLSQFVTFVFGWQWEIKCFISIIIPFYSLLFPNLLYFLGCVFVQTTFKLGSWSTDVWSFSDQHKVVPTIDYVGRP